jgi:hypothetical protein
MFGARLAVLSGAGRGLNLVANPEWVGGDTPTGWATGSTTGTRTAGDSIYHPGHKSIRFVCSTTRANTGFTIVLPAGAYYTQTATLEAVTTPCNWNQLFAASTSIGYYVNGILVTTAGGTAISAQPGDRLAHVTFTATSINQPVWGVGAQGNATGDMTLSRPGLFAGRRP